MIYLALGLTALIGLLLVPSKLHLNPASKLGLAFAAGAGAISVQMFFFTLAGIPWSRLTLLLPWALAAALWVYLHNKDISKTNLSGINWPFALGFAGIAAIFIVSLRYERLMPLSTQAWDAWAIWLLKAKAFYLDGGIRPFLERGAEYNTQLGYPLLVPLHAAFLYVVAGGVDDYAAKVTTPCFFVALLALFYGYARRFGERTPALIATVMVASVTALGNAAFEYAGYADVPLALFLFVAAASLYAWYRTGHTVDLGIAVAAATAAAWTKNEGQVVLLGVLLLAGARMAVHRAHPRLWALLLLPPMLLLIPWSLVRQSYEISAAGFVPLLDFDLDLFRIAVRRLAALAAQPDLMNLTFYLFAAGTVGALLVKVHGPFWTLPGLVLLHLMGALLAYATGRNEIEWWLGTSADRILAQVAPLALLVPVVVLSRWDEHLKHKPPEPVGQAGPPAARRKRPRGPKPKRPRQ